MTSSSGTPFGSWKSPITSNLIVGETVKLSQIQLDDKDIYWIEMRPSEGGRNIIVKRAENGEIADITPSDFNSRTRAHEYGGSAYIVAGKTVYFSNFSDQRLYKQPDGNNQPQALSPGNSLRFADVVFDAQRNRLIGVVEDHTQTGNEAQNYLASINLTKQEAPVPLVSGCDFYSNPVLSPDGKKLAWLCWNHPNMPWDGTELWLAEIDEAGKITNENKIAGGAEESIFQPQWAPDGQLYFVSDQNGWWNLHTLQNGQVHLLHNREAEFALPQWIFGMSTYGFDSAESLICTYFENAAWHMARINTRTGDFAQIVLPFTFVEGLRMSSGQAVFVAGSEISSKAIVQLDLSTLEFRIIRRSADAKLDSTYFSRPEAIEFPTEGGVTAKAYFYRPQNRDYSGLEDALPPLLVKSHGGPTAATSSALELRTQFWTSRGFAVLDVDYGGSTGYGREYRLRLEGRWGVVDVDDCVNGAKYLVEKKLVDGERVAIAGGSAGGYTTLSALTFRDFFKAGASYYGICDLEALTRDTHKFESRYLDRLVGPYPEKKDLYQQRSPIHATEKLSCPVILMQGLEDKIVPPNQAEMMVEALRKKGLAVAYVPFPGEQHGFRKAESIKRSLEVELYFYSKIFGFELSDEVEAVKIDNL